MEWFNQVEAAYRSEIRELFDINFARFDAKLEQHITQIESTFERRIAQAEVNFERRIAKLQTTLLTWMFVFWVTSLGTLIAINKL